MKGGDRTHEMSFRAAGGRMGERIVNAFTVKMAFWRLFAPRRSEDSFVLLP